MEISASLSSDKSLRVSDENLYHAFYVLQKTVNTMVVSVLHRHAKLKSLSPSFRSIFFVAFRANQRVFQQKIGFQKNTWSSCPYLLFCVETVQPNPMDTHKPKLPLLAFETIFSFNSWLLTNFCSQIKI